MGGGTGAGARPGDDAVDLATLAADDRLLDLVASGQAGPGGDTVGQLLAAWRTDLEADSPAAPAVRAESGSPAQPAPPRPHRLSRLMLAAAAAVAVFAGLGVAVRHTGPGGTLWPITRLVYPQQAEVLAAEHAIAAAREAATAGRTDEARRRLDEAAVHTARVRDPAVANRLWAEIDALRRTLAGLTSTGPSGAPAASAAATPAPPAGTSSPGGLVPGLPPVGTTLPLPTPPLPSLPLPSLPLPGLPG